MLSDDEVRKEYAAPLGAATELISTGLDDLLDDVLAAILTDFDQDPDQAPITEDARTEVADALIRLAVIAAFKMTDITLTSTEAQGIIYP